MSKIRAADRNTAIEDIPVVLEIAINETAKRPYEPRTVQEHITREIAANFQLDS